MADGRFKQEFLDAHNRYRAQHGSPALMYRLELCRAAQERANDLLRIHTSEHNYRENVCSCKSTPQAAVDTWYGEIKDYYFINPGLQGHQSNTMHFTQVVWESTTELGVGLATDGNTKFIVVCQYKSPGNINYAGYYEKK